MEKPDLLLALCSRRPQRSPGMGATVAIGAAAFGAVAELGTVASVGGATIIMCGLTDGLAGMAVLAGAGGKASGSGPADSGRSQRLVEGFFDAPA